MLRAVRPAATASVMRSRNGANFDPGDERKGAIAPASIFLIARLTVLRSSWVRRAISRRGTPRSRHSRIGLKEFQANNPSPRGHRGHTGGLEALFRVERWGLFLSRYPGGAYVLAGTGSCACCGSPLCPLGRKATVIPGSRSGAHPRPATSASCSVNGSRFSYSFMVAQSIRDAS